jgi:hypothetical protein
MIFFMDCTPKDLLIMLCIVKCLVQSVREEEMGFKAISDV